MNFFKTIRGRIISLFILILLFMQVIIWSFAYSQVSVVNDYAQISDNMITAYDLLDNSRKLNSEYLRLLRGEDVEESYQLIAEYESIILKDINLLEITVVNSKSKQSFRGIKNIILRILEDKNAGVSAYKNEDIVDAYSHYDSMIKNQEYAKEVTANLIFAELERTQTLHNTVISNRNLYFVIGAVVLIVSSIVSLIYSTIFINRVTYPIVRISYLSDEIAKGRYRRKIPKRYLAYENEIGILSRSLQKMISILLENIDNLRKSNNEIMKTKDKLEQSNKDLEAMNKAMIDREVKMVELKKQIEELEKNAKRL